jgi:hypothetical protein|tara:strand:+ start:4314 stop:4451 length:138 start_codon:yes stop_codon:yes gene_type:complete
MPEITWVNPSSLDELRVSLRGLEGVMRELGWTWVYIPIFNQKKDP